MLRDDEKALIIRLLEALHPGVKVYLFGSRARGNNSPRSDYDLALDTGFPMDIIEVAIARNVLEAGLHIPWKIDEMRMLIDMIDARNQTAHVYDELQADTVGKKIEKYEKITNHTEPEWAKNGQHKSLQIFRLS